MVMGYEIVEHSPDYTAARAELQQAEIELMRQRERVAEQRRQLPEGPAVDNYVFEEGPPRLDDGDTPVRQVRMSELFGGPGRALVVYHFMFGKAQTSPCPMCTMWIDGFNGVANHVGQNADLVIAAAADPPAVRSWARERGWHNLRLLSCGASTFKRDFGSEDENGNQDSTVSVFTRDASGVMRHSYTTHPRMSDEIDQRGIDLLCPTWHFLDLTPSGRGDWYAELDYG